MKKILIIGLALLGFYACEGGDDYLVDGGLSQQEVGMSTVDFFRSHSQLDTLALIIERAGMEDVFNGQNTVFAPNNMAIQNYVNKRLTDIRETDPTAEFTVNDIEVDTLTKYLGGYVFDESIKRENMVKEQGVIYTAVNGEERRISLEPSGDYGNQLESKPEYVYYTAMVGADWDEWNATVNNSDERDKKTVVKTSNLISTNGVIHVLQGGHTLFNYERD
ncbi:Fasciclin domain-containing protein [Zhouia amylolytica]|uniref:FAS1 domain-containing protein n=2 Tax=Zhouia amylolytica TaxID=376730 RepID=W2ULP4_9FLAO|nr:fasciclin domain-containing protein [Zhouia amylolytica]ETN94894.1 hypothetical protein P278_20520 [Zhouia amylolytica AD3]SFS66361.1 Fasciclin domain-containing protein [Zhouia amylolytica]